MDALITKLDTTNLGNEILSDEIIRLATPKGMHVLGRPLDLHRYRIERLPVEPRAALRQFIAWADVLSTVMSLVRSTPTVPVPQAKSRVRLRGERQVSQRKNGIFRFWNTVAENLPMGPRYLARLQVLRRVRSVVYSGAGEVGEYDPFLRQALELELLLRFGVRVHAVNHSVVTESERMNAILGHIYRRFTSVVVRGQRSREKLISLGVSGHLITIAPDTAWCAPRVEVNKAPGVRVGITVNGFAADTVAWQRIIRGIQAAGAEVLFLTSDPGYDLTVGRSLASATGIRVVQQATDAEHYRRELGQLDVVVSERLHTAVMAAVQGVPVIPIERGVHKTAEVFEVFGQGIDVVQPIEGWTEVVVQKTKEFLNAPDPCRSRLLIRSLEMAHAARSNVPDQL
jgi:polysaccharide pyruvyl transferase WcaK-like protein